MGSGTKIPWMCSAQSPKWTRICIHFMQEHSYPIRPRFLFCIRPILFPCEYLKKCISAKRISFAKMLSLVVSKSRDFQSLAGHFPIESKIFFAYIENDVKCFMYSFNMFVRLFSLHVQFLITEIESLIIHITYAFWLIDPRRLFFSKYFMIGYCNFK